MIEGMVIGYSRKGFFVQDDLFHEGQSASSGIFVYAAEPRPARGRRVQVWGRVADFYKEEGDKPVTQLHSEGFSEVEGPAIPIQAIELAALLPEESGKQAAFLNSIEGMLCVIKAGARFLAPSNPFGDYVLCTKTFYEQNSALHAGGGLRVDPNDPHRWFPSMRALDLRHAPSVNVGDTLGLDAAGPLNYRAKAYQIAVQGRIRIDAADLDMQSPAVTESNAEEISVMTLNTFNLDPKKERASYVNDPRRDIDDDLADKRFDFIACDIVKAGCPDIIALQEMQDDDGAEITEVVKASKNHRTLIAAVQKRAKQVKSGNPPDYAFAELAPVAGEDGGQPGGNIRNSYLYNTKNISLVHGETGAHLIRLCQQDEAFADSRKPLLAQFEHRQSGHSLTVINIHLASKRQQRSLFAIDSPAYDEREAMRIRQAELVKAVMDQLAEAGLDCYVTGDFNDTEFSRTLAAFTGSDHINLVDKLQASERYDYNHRGKLQVLMHGIVPKALRNFEQPHYQVLHGNELQGVQPGSAGIKASDHAYVIARFLPRA